MNKYTVQVRVDTLFGRPWRSVAVDLTAQEALTLQNKLMNSGEAKVRTFKQEPEDLVA